MCSYLMGGPGHRLGRGGEGRTGIHGKLGNVVQLLSESWFVEDLMWGAKRQGTDTGKVMEILWPCTVKSLSNVGLM